MKNNQKDTPESAELQIASLDYMALGRRIQVLRKTQDLTQERLAELVDLSTTHMSHIENGSTKVSLPSLVLIANALNTTLDNLLLDNLTVFLKAYDADFKELLEDCSDRERELIYTVAADVKQILRK